MTQSTSSNAVSTHTDATTTKHLAQKSNLGQFTLLSFLFHCLCDVTTWTRLFPVFKLCCRKAHLKETQGRIMDLNDKIAVVTQTLQQALGGLQSKIEEDTRKVIQTFRHKTPQLCTVTYKYKRTPTMKRHKVHMHFSRGSNSTFSRSTRP